MNVSGPSADMKVMTARDAGGGRDGGPNGCGCTPLPGDVGRLGAARYVHLGTVARLARMKFPEDHDGDIALAVAATRVIASAAYPIDEQEVRRMAERDQVSGVRDIAAQSRQAGAPPRRSVVPGSSSCPGSGITCLPRCTRR